MSFELPSAAPVSVAESSRAEVRERITLLQKETARLKEAEKAIDAKDNRVAEVKAGVLRLLRSSALPLVSLGAYVGSGEMAGTVAGMGLEFASVSAFVVGMVGATVLVKDFGIGVKQIHAAIKGENPYKLTAEEDHILSK